MNLVELGKVIILVQGGNNMKSILKSYMFYSDTTNLSWAWKKGEYASKHNHWQNCYLLERNEMSKDWSNGTSFSKFW